MCLKARTKNQTGAGELRRKSKLHNADAGKYQLDREATEYYKGVFLLLLSTDRGEDSTINHIELTLLSMLLQAGLPGTPSSVP